MASSSRATYYTVGLATVAGMHDSGRRSCLNSDCQADPSSAGDREEMKTRCRNEIIGLLRQHTPQQQQHQENKHKTDRHLLTDKRFTPAHPVMCADQAATGWQSPFVNTICSLKP